MSASNPNTTVSWRVFDSLGFIALLVGAEQIVGVFVELPHSDWRVGVALTVLGPVFYSFTGGWGRVREYIANLRRLRIVRLARPEKVDIIEEGRQRHTRVQIRQRVYTLTQGPLQRALEAGDKGLRASVGPVLGADINVIARMAQAYEYLINDTHKIFGHLSVSANRSLQDALEDGKLPVGALVDLLVETTSCVFRLGRLLDNLARLPQVGSAQLSEIEQWRQANERLKSELLETASVDGFSALAMLDLRPSRPHGLTQAP